MCPHRFHVGYLARKWETNVLWYGRWSSVYVVVLVFVAVRLRVNVQAAKTKLRKIRLRRMCESCKWMSPHLKPHPWAHPHPHPHLQSQGQQKQHHQQQPHQIRSLASRCRTYQGDTDTLGAVEWRSGAAMRWWGSQEMPCPGTYVVSNI